MAASQCGHDHCVNLLIQSGADVNKALSDEYLNYTALMFAVVYCRKRCADMLIQAGADVNKVNSQGYSILMTAAHSKQSSNCDEKYHGAIKRFDMRCMKILLRARATVNNLPRTGYTVSKVSETGAFVNSVPRARFSVSNMPGRGPTVNNVLGSGTTVNKAPEEGTNVPGANANNLLGTGATVNNLLGKCNNKAELTVTEKLPAEVIVLLFVAGEIFTANQLKETVQQGIFTKPGSGGDPRGKREDHGDVLRDLDHVAWEDWFESGGTAGIPPKSPWKVSF